VTNSSGQLTAQYAYDALGRRIKHLVPIAQSPSQLESGGPTFTVNDGSVQRSMVWSLTVAFASPVRLGTNAITLSEVGGGTAPIAWTASNNNQTYVVTFTGSNIVGGSLPNGAYDLTIHSALVTVASTKALAGSDQGD
jgi:YD repeat-containing protein